MSQVRNLMTLLVLTISIIKGNILHVSTTGNDESGDGSVNNPYLTIQKGIDEASSMDTVLVLNGIWQGGVTIDNKQITLMGESMTDTKLNIAVTEPNITIVNNSDTVRVENLKIKRGNAELGGSALNVSNSLVVAKNLDLSNNIGLHGGAIRLSQSEMFLKDSRVYLNSCDSLGGAIYVENSKLEVSGLVLSNNSAHLGGAVYLDLTSTVSVHNSEFLNNGAAWGGAIATVGSGQLDVSTSTFLQNSSSQGNPNSDPDFPTYGGGGAIYQEYADSLKITECYFATNTAKGTDDDVFANLCGRIDNGGRMDVCHSESAIIAAKAASATIFSSTKALPLNFHTFPRWRIVSTFNSTTSPGTTGLRKRALSIDMK